jgi:hypothetical protein
MSQSKGQPVKNVRVPSTFVFLKVPPLPLPLSRKNQALCCAPAGHEMASGEDGAVVQAPPQKGAIRAAPKGRRGLQVSARVTVEKTKRPHHHVSQLIVAFFCFLNAGCGDERHGVRGHAVLRQPPACGAHRVLRQGAYDARTHARVPYCTSSSPKKNKTFFLSGVPTGTCCFLLTPPRSPAPPPAHTHDTTHDTRHTTHNT